MAETSKMTLEEKLFKINDFVDVIRKNKSGFNYKYVSEDEILVHLRSVMRKYRVRLSLRMVHGSMSVTPFSYTKVKFVKDKDIKQAERLEEVINEVLVTAEVFYRFTNVDNPAEYEDVPWFIVGQQADASQAVGSALSYNNRYFLLKYFQIATPEDDPDKWRSKQQELEAANNARQEQAAASAIVEEIAAAINGHLDAIGDEEQLKAARKSIADVVKKHVKDENGKPSGNYNLIDNTKTATAVLEAVKAHIGGKKS